MTDSVMEDELNTFDGWLRYQAIDASALTPDELQSWRSTFNEVLASAASTPKVGLMKLHRIPGQHLYAVAIHDDDTLWLTLWVKRSPKGDIFIMYPRRDGGWNPHTSYHRDGRLHSKSYDCKHSVLEKQPPLAGAFKGTETLGVYLGHGGRTIGAICNPEDFTGIVEVRRGVLGPRDGAVAIDLVEPGIEPTPPVHVVLRREIFRDVEPHLVVSLLDTRQLA